MIMTTIAEMVPTKENSVMLNIKRVHLKNSVVKISNVFVKYINAMEKMIAVIIQTKSDAVNILSYTFPLMMCLLE